MKTHNHINHKKPWVIYGLINDALPLSCSWRSPLAILVTLLQVDSHMVMQDTVVQESNVDAQGEYVFLPGWSPNPRGTSKRSPRQRRSTQQASQCPQHSAYQYLPYFLKYPFHFPFSKIFLKVATIKKVFIILLLKISQFRGKQKKLKLRPSALIRPSDKMQKKVFESYRRE